MDDIELIRPIKKGDHVYLFKRFEEYTPYAEGGPVEITGFRYSYTGKVTEYEFLHIKPRREYEFLHIEPRRSSSSNDIRTFGEDCIDIKRTNDHMRNSIYQIKSVPTLPNI